jgi:hypothetical protein
VTHCCRPMKLITHTVILGLLLNSTAIAMAGNDFGADWQPRPLVDTSIKPTTPAQTQAISSKPPVPAQPELEAKLKPAEPFIQDVEARLYIKPKPGATLVSRLDTLQTVLFGARQYQDASELLGKLAEIFPQEAAKAQAGLHQQLLNSKPAGTAGSQKPQVSSATPSKPIVQPSAGTYQTQPTQQQLQYAPAVAASPQRVQQPAPKAKKKRFWQDDWDSDFENDPFFNDSLNNNSSQNRQQQGPSKLSSVGQGLAGLAMMAGGVAGTYYLNKKLGNNSLPNNQQYYNNPYYGNYGYPYGGNPYGYGYAAPYGYGTYAIPYTNGYPPPAGAYGSPYGGIITTQPYQRYGSSTSTFGGVSPLGVPTGF